MPDAVDNPILEVLRALSELDDLLRDPDAEFEQMQLGLKGSFPKKRGRYRLDYGDREMIAMRQELRLFIDDNTRRFGPARAERLRLKRQLKQMREDKGDA